MNAAAMSFDQPLLLALSLLLPALAVALVVVGVRRRRARLARLGKGPAVDRLIPVSSRAPAWPRAARLGAALAFAGLALAGPRWGAERGVVRAEGIDVVLALDASNSMLAADERPNRLERMKQEVRRLRSLAPGDRVALIAFAGRSYILTPLTVDDSALELFLDNLDPSVVGQSGSSISRAIGQATDLLLSTKTGSDRAIVLMSDGEAFEPEAEIIEAARRAGEAGISLVTVGFGTEQGSTIPVEGPGGERAVKRDETGQVVVSRYHPELLRAAAQAARGTFVDAGATDKAARVRRALGSLRTQQRATASGEQMTPRFQLFLLPALLLALLDTLLTDRRRRPRAGATPAAATAAALVLALLLPSPARADALDDGIRAYKARRYAEAVAHFRRAVERGDRSATALYNLGTAMLAADSAGLDLPRAADVLERAAQSRDPEIRFRALFNMGLAHLRRGLRGRAAGDTAADAALDAALASYKRALLLRSADGDAKWNYELALRERRSGGGGGGGGGQTSQSPQPDPSSRAPSPAPAPAGGVGQRQAEQLLESAARDEREVQSRRQRQNRPAVVSGGKDWE
ncbi:MAG TPA: VWA domain-containing protein [Gemmatimonadaceae bacterium]|nr:VWA domain-containing protein [Gemmatimonadaceae bacterium]